MFAVVFLHGNLFKGKENRKNNNEGLDNLHIILLIHMYALGKIS